MSDGLSCYRCGADCSGKDHARDKAGRVACMSCFNEMRARGKVSVRGITNAPIERPVKPVHAEGEPDQRPGNNEVAPFSLDEGEGLEVIALAPEAPEEERKRCPGCGSLMHKSSLQCASCGYEIGVAPSLQRLSVDRRAERVCGNCKYDLTGTIGDKCPECGTPVSESISTRRAETEERLRSQTIRQSLVLICVGVVFCALIRLGWDAIFGFSAVASLTTYGLMFAMGYTASLGAYLLLAKLWFGFSESIGVTIVQVVSALVMADFVLSLIWGLNSCYFPYMIWLGVYCWALVRVMEHTGLEACVVGVVTWVIYVAMSIAISALVN